MDLTLKRLTALACLLTLTWAASQGQTRTPGEPGTLIDVVNEGSTDPFEIQSLATELFGRHGPPVIENSVQSYRIRYLTTGLDGQPTEVLAQLFVPHRANPEEAPLFVFGSGTTGIADACAPTRESLYPHPLGHYRPYLLSYAGRGLTAIIPDYLGFNDPDRMQSYFNAKAEARVMLDAVRAVQEFYQREGASPATRRDVFLGGYSQGGHAAFAAADLRNTYAPEVELAGIIGFGATTDVESLLREGPFYAPYIALSFSQDFGSERFDPSQILAPQWLPGLDQAAGTMCVDRAQIHYPFDGSRIFTPRFAAALYGHQLEREYPEVAAVLRENHAGLSGHGVPALIVQGEDDVIVWNTTQTRFVKELCDAGSEVLYLRYPGVRHRETRPAGFEESLGWMRSLGNGVAAPSTCALLEE